MNLPLGEKIEMSFIMESTPEETIQLLIDFFIGRREKILCTNRPSLIRTEIGTWFGLTPGVDPKGEIESLVTQRKDGSYVNFHFNFTTAYLSHLILAVICSIVIYLISSTIANSSASELSPLVRGDYLSMMNSVTIFVILVVLLIIVAYAAYNASKIKKTFISEFDKFIRSSKTKK